MLYPKAVKIMLIAALLMSWGNIFAQSSWTDSLNSRFNAYQSKQSDVILFAHFDKNIYVQNENVWFTAYLLNRRNNDNPGVLSVILVNDLTKAIVLQQKFIMVNGVSFGNVFLPDTIPAGSYSFMLYANHIVNDLPKDVFIQHITLMSASDAPFRLSLTLDTTASIRSKRKVVLTALNVDGLPISKARISYTFGEGIYKATKGRTVTNALGRDTILIPAEEVKPGSNVLEVHAKYGKQVENVSLTIPAAPKTISVKFYPEGGYLISGTTSLVGWEVKTKEGQPIKATGILYDNNIPIDTIRTNEYGMGKFRLAPLRANTYTVKLIENNFSDSVFKLPTILVNGPVISIKNAVTNDTLKMKLASEMPQTFNVLIHNYRQVFYNFKVTLNAAGKMILVSMGNIPKGLTTITILDSARRPCAERLFFAHYNKRSLLRIQTDQKQYSKRQKVTLSLTFDTPDTGFVSVACVQDSRITIKNNNEIDSYTYLLHELGGLPLKQNYMGSAEDDRNYLENILLIKGWRKYKWQDIMNAKIKDSLNSEKTLAFTGVVKWFNSPLRKPVKLLVVTDSLMSTLMTDKKGYFKLDDQKIIAAEDKKVYLSVMQGSSNKYNIQLNDPYVPLNKLVVKQFYVDPENVVTVSSSNDSFTLKGFEHAIAIKEVKIKATVDNNFSNTGTFKPIANQCGDYVCVYNILNCPNHKNDGRNREPVIGEKYYSYNSDDAQSGKLGTIIYQGCVLTQYDNSLSIPGIYYSKEFYPADYSYINPSQPEYLSTIFWRHLVKVTQGQSLDLTFYTSDITGVFKVIAQGITKDDVVYGEKEFIVK